MKKPATCLLLIFLAISCVSFFSCADNYWDRLQGGQTATIPEGIFVNGITGSDSNGTGSYDEPYATITKGITEAVNQGESAVHVAAGAYTESVTLVDGVSLYGGYSSFNWTDRDNVHRSDPGHRTEINAPAGISTAVQGTGVIDPSTYIDGFVITGGLGPGLLNTGVSLTFNANPTIRNNTINGGAGDDSQAIYISNASPTISNNDVYGGGATDSSVGIFIDSGSTAYISGNHIEGGFSASNARGIRNVNSNSSISWNTIIAGVGTMNAFGIWNSGGPAPTISNNTIRGGPVAGPVPGPDTRGIMNSSSPAVIIRNHIDGGPSSGQSFGVYNNNSDARIYNNTVYGGDSITGSWGIRNTGLPSAEIFNNTINGGNSPGNPVYCISVNNSQPRICNNILFVFGAGGPQIGIWEENNLVSDPAEVQNNDIFDCTALYRDENGPDIVLIAGVDALNPPFTGGNRDVILTFDANYRITGAVPPANLPLVTQGGLDGVAEAWGFNTDKDNDPRTVPWSMGAYE